MKKTFKYKMQRMRQSRGFTLLLAALVASVALTLGSSIYSIVSKELSLSSIGQDSEYAFYAADTAAECALYWDARTDEHPYTFATSTDSKNAFAPATSITCDGHTVPTSVQEGTNAATTTIENASSIGFDLFTDSSSGNCANITVAKHLNTQNNAIVTVITANGYSVACASVGTAKDALQRTVDLQY